MLGGRGFIGSHLIEALLARGERVRCFDRPNVIPLGRSLREEPNFKLFEGDLANDSEIAAALEGCDVCYHLVSTTLPKSSNADPVYDIETNLVSTVKLLNQCVTMGVKKVVFSSSGGTVYGNPLKTPIDESHPVNPVCSYGITKLAIEKYLELFRELHGLDYTVLRIANPFGERQRTHASQGAVAVFMGKVLRGETVDIWGDGSVVRDYIYISDVIESFTLAASQRDGQRIFNIGSGQGQNINEILDAIGRVTGLSVARHYLPGRPFDVPISVLAIDQARASLGWSPKTKFEDGLRRYSDWLKLNPAEYA